MNIREDILKIARQAKMASQELANLSSSTKNKALLRMAESIEKNRERIIEENKKDVNLANKKELSKPLIDRLTLDEKRIRQMSKSLEEIVSIEDPIGKIENIRKRPNGLQIGKMVVPLGVIGIIYEARPNVTIDAAALCLKAGNATILRGGSEAIYSNIILADLLKKAGQETGLPSGSIQLIKTTDRRAVTEMLKLNAYIDVIIPRGGEELIRVVMENSTIPVIKHYKGICHIYVDEEADLKMAEEISFNAKVQRPGVCNAMETLLINEKIAAEFLPGMIKRLQEAAVEIRGDEKTCQIARGIKKASEEDWQTEYLDLILSIKVVEGIEEAINHINNYGSHHSDAIITNNYAKSRQFLQKIDSAAVYVNASTRFTDGAEFGLGAEIGISTQKLHARGPMGVNELTSTKFIIWGDGQVRK
ncbi:glutamate-5-semialdehyde dehydrogenase [Candidatus Aerophobetes bacterium]|uniref:Gamma-glutamyl phosphate reductase n=1 Tax=Aerophobetes bacterium TaxID=2030807 RepID=A0A523Y3Y0_UNCAE|nr:MAG: glutamate-5-semialdehyde dehydrogenase [Candidatus Aerophobetes bacterium]